MSDAIPELTVELLDREVQIRLAFELTAPTYGGSPVWDAYCKIDAESNGFRATVHAAATTADAVALRDALRLLLDSEMSREVTLPDIGYFARLAWSLKSFRHNQWKLACKVMQCDDGDEITPANLRFEAIVARDSLESFHRQLTAMVRFIEAQ